MKFFHLADLHIGKSVNGFSMLEDQKHVFAQILEYVESEHPDVVVVSGDVYDKTQPAAEAVALCDDFLTGLAQAGVPVLMVAGNHDSPQRLAFAGRIMQQSGIHIYGVFDGSLHKVTFSDQWGEVDFYLMPYLRPAAVRPFFGDETIESHADAVKVVLDALAPSKAGRSVLVAHQFVVPAGGEAERSDSETEPVGGVNAVSASLFGAYDYVALGHLHGPQKVGRAGVRYAGSPLKYSFSECFQKKGVTVVQLGPKGEMDTSVLPLVPLRDMRRISGPMEQLLQKDVVAGGNAGDYLHVTLTDEQEPPEAMARLRLAYPNVMELRFNNSRTRAQSSFEGEAAPDNKTPMELLEDFFSEQNGRSLNPRQREMARALLKDTEETE